MFVFILIIFISIFFFQLFPSPSLALSLGYQQQQKISQTQCQHQNGQKVNTKNMQTAHQDQQTLMDLQEIDDLRKKRCADRYDSSESSDR